MGVEKSTEKQPIEKSNPDKSFSFQDANLMQADLIRRSGIVPLEWVGKNAPAFRKIIESKPDLVELYRQNSEAAEELIERQLRKRTFR